MRRKSLWMPLLCLVLMAGVMGTTACKKKPPAEPPAPPAAPAPAPKPPPPPPPPPPAPAPTPQPPARPSLETLNSQLRPVYFDFDKSNLRGDVVSTLDANAALMQKYPDLGILIAGHCDERGTIEYNLALGDRRSNSATEGLTSRGVSRSRITTISYGEERAADPGHNETAWAKNRRAEFRFVQR